MRDPIENISKLQKQLNDLKLENQILKITGSGRSIL
jgi:hypothetical protein